MARSPSGYDSRTRPVLGLLLAFSLGLPLIASHAFAAFPYQMLEERDLTRSAPMPAFVEAARVAVDPRPVLEGAPELTLPMLDGSFLRAIRQAGEERPGAWRGTLEDGGSVVLVARGAYVLGAIYAADATYELYALEDGGVALARLDSELFPPCSNESPASDESQAPGLPTELPELLGQASESVGEGGAVVRIDLLTVYTPQARDSAGGVAGIEATIAAAVEASNTTFANSGMDVEFALVHTELTSYEDSGSLGSDLNWLANDATIAALRNQVGADMVGLIVSSPGCGIARVMRNVGPGFEDDAFQVTARGCAVGNLTFAHEHGHNLGGEHDPANGIAPNSASYPWSFGHFHDGSYRTVMSYSNQCNQGCTRHPYWSNPAVNFMGLPTGIADERENARSFTLTAPVAEAFRESLFLFGDGFEDGDISAWSGSMGF